MTNKENARFYARRIKEEIGMSEHSIERVSEIITEALNERDRLFSEYLKNKINTVAANPRRGLLTIFRKKIIIGTLKLILLDRFNENMIYTVEFYSKMRDEVLTVPVEAPDRNMAVDAVCHYYMADKLAVRSVRETPEATPKFQICRVPNKNI